MTDPSRTLNFTICASQLNFAAAAAPALKLCINDYGIEDINAKSQKMASIASKLLQDNVPLHCIGKAFHLLMEGRLSNQANVLSCHAFLSGFESHFVGGDLPTDLDNSMAQFTSLGLEVPLTELDIRISVDSNDLASNTEMAVQYVLIPLKKKNGFLDDFLVE